MKFDYNVTLIVLNTLIASVYANYSSFTFGEFSGSGWEPTTVGYNSTDSTTEYTNTTTPTTVPTDLTTENNTTYTTTIPEVSTKEHTTFYTTVPEVTTKEHTTFYTTVSKVTTKEHTTFYTTVPEVTTKEHTTFYTTVSTTIEACPTECIGCSGPCKRKNLDDKSCVCPCISGYTPINDGCKPVQCENEEVVYPNTPSVNVTFPLTQAGYSNSTEELCPTRTSNEGLPYGTRQCSIDGEWQKPKWLSSCNVTLENYENLTITTEADREEIANDLEVITSDPQELDAGEVTLTVDVLEEVVNTETLTTNTSTSVVSTVGNLLAVSEEELEDSGEAERILETLDSVSEKVELEEGEVYQEVSSTIAVAVVEPTEGDIEQGFGFGTISLSTPTDLGFRSDQINTFVSKPDENVTSYVIVPKEAIDKSPDKRISFYAFPDDKVFRASSTTSKTKSATGLPVNSDVVLSASVVGTNGSILVSDLKDPIKIQFALNQTVTESSLENSRTYCAYWNEEIGEWTYDGDETIEYDQESVTCEFNHLTNFATLFARGDISSNINDILNLITLIGSSLSLVCSLLTILVFTCVKKTRTGRARLRRSFVLVNYSLALVLLNAFLILSLVDEISSNKQGCLAIAILIHFSLLSVFGWMMVESVNIYIMTVHFIYNQTMIRNKHVFVPAILWGWIMPAIFVCTLVGVNINYYVRSDGECWIQTDYILYFVTIPTSVFMVINFVLYVVILYKGLFKKKPRHQSRISISRGHSFADQKRQIKGSMVLFVSVGGFWLFGFGIINPNGNETAQIVFACIFTVCNSLQGLMIFLLYILADKSKRKMVKEELTQLKNIYLNIDSSENGIFHNWIQTGKTRSWFQSNTAIYQNETEVDTSLKED